MSGATRANLISEMGFKADWVQYACICVSKGKTLNETNVILQLCFLCVYLYQTLCKSHPSKHYAQGEISQHPVQERVWVASTTLSPSPYSNIGRSRGSPWCLGCIQRGSWLWWSNGIGQSILSTPPHTHTESISKSIRANVYWDFINFPQSSSMPRKFHGVT